MFKQNNTLKIIIPIAIIAIIVLIVIFSQGSSQINKTGTLYVAVPEPSMEKGTIGEIKSGKTIQEVNPAAVKDPIRPIGIQAPNDIFNTAGTILSIGKNFIKIRGNGSNFDDQVKRDLTIVIDKDTKINNQSNIEFDKLLSIGEKVFIESMSNIHGKTEILASYINTNK